MKPSIHPIHFKLKTVLFIALLVVFACEDEQEKEPLSKPYIPI